MNLSRSIELLRAAYNKIDPDGDGYRNLSGFLDAQDTETLRLLASADIKFVSRLAMNRLPPDDVEYDDCDDEFDRRNDGSH